MEIAEAQYERIKILEIAGSNLCCGSAGYISYYNPDAANELGDRKVQKLLATNAQALVSANPGCLLQIQSGLRRQVTKIPAFHVVELLDVSEHPWPKCSLTLNAQYVLACFLSVPFLHAFSCAEGHTQSVNLLNGPWLNVRRDHMEEGEL